MTVRFSAAPLGGASIANLSPNIGFESTFNPFNVGGQNNSTLSVSTLQAKVGAQSLLCVATAPGQFVATAGGPVAQIGETWLFSAWVYVPAGSPPVQLELYGAIAPTQNSAFSTVNDQWQQLSVIGTASSAIGLGHGAKATATAAGQRFYMDETAAVRLNPSSRPVMAARPALAIVPGTNSAACSVTGYGTGGVGSAATVGDAFRQTWTTKATGGGGSLTHDGQRVPVTPGQQVTGTVWSRHSHALVSCVLRLFWMDASGTQVGSPDTLPFVPAANTWERRAIAATAPSGAVSVRAELRVADFSLESAATAPVWQEAREFAFYLGV